VAIVEPEILGGRFRRSGLLDRWVVYVSDSYRIYFYHHDAGQHFDQRQSRFTYGSSVIFSPRVGYAAQLSPNFAIWPRAGITYSYYRVTADNTDAASGAKTEDKLTADFTDVSIEFMAAALPCLMLLFYLVRSSTCRWAEEVSKLTQASRTPTTLV